MFKFTKDYSCEFDFDSDNVCVYDKATKRVLLGGEKLMDYIYNQVYLLSVRGPSLCVSPVRWLRAPDFIYLCWFKTTGNVFFGDHTSSSTGLIICCLR